MKLGTLYSGVSRSTILQECQISEKELGGILKTEESFNLSIVEVSEGQFAYFKPQYLYDLVDQLYTYCSAAYQAGSKISVKEVAKNNSGAINSKYLAGGEGKLIKYAFNLIADD
jgi:hypothetical protein